jgi:hypothetical protein
VVRGPLADSMHPRLQALCGALDRHAIRWCLLRWPSSLSVLSGDIDLLVDARDVTVLRDILHNDGFARVPRPGHSLHFLTYDEQSDSWIWLHFVTELSYGPEHVLRTEAAVECLARRRYVGQIPALAPNDEFWALLLHCLVDKGRIEPRHRSRLVTLAHEAEVASTLARVLASIRPAECSAEHVLECVRSSNWIVLEAVAPALQQALVESFITKRRFPKVRSVLRLLQSVRSVRSRRGVSVALLGPDGAGKSTLAETLQRSF